MTATSRSHNRTRLESKLDDALQSIATLRTELKELSAHMPGHTVERHSDMLDRLQWSARVLHEMLRRQSAKRG